MLKWIVRIVVVGALVAGAYYLRSTVFAPQPIEVSVLQPTRGRVESTITNSKAGTVKAQRRASLSPEIGGRVVDLPLRAGSEVQRGQILMRLDDSTHRAQLEKARRDIATAEARHREACLAADHARREHARHQELAERQIVSQNMLEQLESRAQTSAAGCDAAAAAVASAQAAIALLESELRKTVLRAPFGGVVSELSIELGEYTTPSPPGLPIPPVMEIIDTTSIFISAPMDEVDSARVVAGQRVRTTVDSHPGKSFPGKVVRVAPYVLDIEAQNRTVEIEVELDDQELASSLLPGTSADVEVILETHDAALRLPTATLLEGNAVLVVEEGKLVRREVQVGLRNWDFTEILSGLGTTDRVVSSLDRAEVQPGAEVLIAAESSVG
ncbi:MAG TPA: efflux RND transporter periplasmic adaptor subunit [Acidobacteriota bacterium]|nr:efflux RND transporter periplasmic adaptor subunit [Acidobacteriota bacterium]